MAAVGVLMLAVGIWTARQVERDALVINVAGRQRMLIQRATAEYLAGLVMARESRDGASDATARLFERTLAVLMEGGTATFEDRSVSLQPTTSRAFRAALAETAASWEGLRRVLGTHPSDVDGNAAARRLAELRRLAGRTVELMSRAVRVYEKEASARAARLHGIQLALVPLWFGVLGIGLVGERRARASEAELREQLEAANARLVPFAAIVECSDDAIVSAGLDRVARSWNPGAERLFGYSAEEALGRALTFIVPPELPDDEAAIFEKLACGEPIVDHETRRARSDGSLVDVSITASPIRDPEGRITGAVGIFRDITERKRMDAALHDTIAKLDTFTSMMSHDLREPLRGIQGFARALREDFVEVLDPGAQDYVRRIEAGAARMDALIEDLLAYGRVSKTVVTSTAVSLERAVRDALDLLSPDLEARGAEVAVERPLHEVRAHRGTLTQVLLNLLANAVKFVEPGVTPKVRLWVEDRGNEARLWVEDNGIGVAPEHHERIFRPFERLHGIEKYPGTGMGLAIVRDGTERMAGRVGVESRAGGGSRFWIELPAAERRA
jgi:PAS domain S-box-containing protein